MTLEKSASGKKKVVVRLPASTQPQGFVTLVLGVPSRHPGEARCTFFPDDKHLIIQLLLDNYYIILLSLLYD